MSWLSEVFNLFDPITKLVDEIFTSDEEKNDFKLKLKGVLAEAEQKAQAEVTKRWQSDAQSSWLAQNVRPLSLIFMTLMFVFISVFDGNIGGFTLKSEYVPVYQTLLMTIYGAYFVGRSYQKVTAIKKGK
jgi:hypothetical protein